MSKAKGFLEDQSQLILYIFDNQNTNERAE